MTTAERIALKRYAQVIALWTSRFDTAEIAARLDVPEAIVARWVANFRDQMHAAPAAPMRPLAKAA
jgi:transposase-like protein